MAKTYGLRTATQVFGALSVTAGALSSPAGAFALHKLSGVFRARGSCGSGDDDNGDDSQLDLFESPTRLVNGDDHLRYVRGGVIGNVFLIGGASLVGFLVAASILIGISRYRGLESITFIHACALVRFPALWWVVPVLIVWEPSFLLSLSLLQAGDGAVDVALAIVTLLLELGLVVWIGTVVTKQPFHARFTFFPPTQISSITMLRAWVVQALTRSRGEWISHPQTFIHRFGAVVEGYVVNRQWFILVEFAAAISFSFGEVFSSVDASMAVCDGMLALFAATSIIMLIGLIVLRPYNVAFDFATAVFSNLLTLVACFVSIELEEYLVLVQLVVLLAGFFSVSLRLWKSRLLCTHLGNLGRFLSGNSQRMPSFDRRRAAVRSDMCPVDATAIRSHPLDDDGDNDGADAFLNAITPRSRKLDHIVQRELIAEALLLMKKQRAEASLKKLVKLICHSRARNSETTQRSLN